MHRIAYSYLFVMLMTMFWIFTSQSEGQNMELLSIGEERYYTIEMSNCVVGYCSYVVAERKVYHGEPVYVIQEKAEKHIRYRNRTEQSVHSGVLYMSALNLSPRYQQFEMMMNGEQMKITCEYVDGKVYREVQQKEQMKKDTIEVPDSLYTIAASGLYHEWGFPFRYLPVDYSHIRLNIFVPEVGEWATLDLYLKGMQQVEVDGQVHVCNDFQLARIGHLFIEQSTKELIMFMDPSTNTIVRLSHQKVSGQIETNAESIVAPPPQAIPSDVGIKDIKALSFLKVYIRISAGGVDMSLMESGMQHFEGKVENNVIDGVFEITPMVYTGENAPPYPTESTTSQPLQRFLQPEEMIEWDESIEKMAKVITEGKQNVWEAAVAIASWVHKHLEKWNFITLSAQEAFNRRKGECAGHSFLTVAMCRSVGIPAKVVGGIVCFKPGHFSQHVWVQVYMGKDGWVPLDPIVGEYGRLNASHITFCEIPILFDAYLKIIEFDAK